MPNSQERSRPQNEDELCAAALSLIELLRGIKPLWNEALLQAILEEPEHAANPHLLHDENFKRLCTFEGMLTLAEIWSTSAFISGEAFEKAGLPPGSARERLTATLLGEMEYDALAADNDGVADGSCSAAVNGAHKQDDRNAARFVMSQRRIATGGEYFNLIRKMGGRSNYKPLETEENLHHLMVAFMRRFARLVLLTTGEGEEDDQNDQPGQRGRPGDSGVRAGK